MDRIEANRALRLVRGNDDCEGALERAYVRLAAAWANGTGVRLTDAEVDAIMEDDAVRSAAFNTVEDVLRDAGGL